MNRWICYGALAILFVLHNDWWLWDDARVVAGLPVGLTYHLLYALATAAVMLLIARRAWPSHLEVDSDEEPRR